MLPVAWGAQRPVAFHIPLRAGEQRRNGSDRLGEENQAGILMRLFRPAGEVILRQRLRRL